jgi:hypothetical protein
MGTGIVSLGFSYDGRVTLERILFAIAAAAWVALVPLFAAHFSGPRERRLAPGVLTCVTATAVLGSGIVRLGSGAAGAAALSVALALWVVLLPGVLGHLSTPVSGTGFMVVVSTEALAVLAASVAPALGAAWLLDASLAPLVAGIAVYAFALARFDRHELQRGPGDHWVAGGALGICALAAAEILTGARALGTLEGLRPALEDGALALWALAALWLPVLVMCEAAWPRPRYTGKRWATVFPLGMYAVSSFAVGSAAGASALTGFARVWVWIAAAAWLLVSLGLLRQALRLRAQGPPRRARSG